MPTRNRRAWLPQAIKCFQLQAYANRKLIIVADGEKVDDLVPVKEDPRITLIHLTEAERPVMLAGKFNLACNFAKSEILCKWDDDDYYGPRRIEDQVKMLQESGKAVVGYHTALFHDGSSWFKYQGHAGFALGTSVCFTREWWQKHPFEPSKSVPHGVPQQAGSDGVFSAEAAAAHQLFSVDAGEMIVASIHSQHTSPRRHTSAPYKRLEGFPGVPGYSWPLRAATDGVAA